MATPPKNNDQNSLSPAVQNLIQAKSKQAQHDGEQLKILLNNNDINGALIQIDKLLHVLSRDGVKLSDASGSGLYPSAFSNSVGNLGSSLANSSNGIASSLTSSISSGSTAAVAASYNKDQLLPSKAYYQLWITVIEQLDIFEDYLLNLKDETLIESLKTNLYTQVQYQENILQRLYLMTVVGSWLVKSKFETFTKTFEDLVDMSIGIQNSQRGLFLRAYILQKIRHFIKNPVEFPDVKILDFVKTILLNFGEMNKLWVRMQYVGKTKEQSKRTQERIHIRMLLGKNLVYMSELGDKKLSIELYEYLILPEILKQAVGSKDKVAQDYLFECLIQVYNDNFHVATMETFIKQLSSSVRACEITQILPQFIERIQAQSLLDIKTGKNSAYYVPSKKAYSKNGYNYLDSEGSEDESEEDEASDSAANASGGSKNVPKGNFATDEFGEQELIDRVKLTSILVRDLIVERLSFCSKNDIIEWQTSILKFVSNILSHLSDKLTLVNKTLNTTAKLLGMHHTFHTNENISTSSVSSHSYAGVYNENADIPQQIAPFGAEFTNNLRVALG